MRSRRGARGAVSGQAWYQLDKTGSKTAVVRIKDTSAHGSSCTGIYPELDNSLGTDGVLAQTGLSDGGAVSFQVTTPGLYYIEIIGWDCTPTGATTYSAEPETTTAWTTPAPPAAGTTKAATSIGTVGSPLRGQKLYQGTAGTVSGQAWYQLDKTGSKTAVVRIEDTTVAGSTSCTSIYAELDNSQGTDGVLAQTGLSDDGAVNFQVTTPGLYYIEIIGWDCTPTGLTTYSAEPETTTAWTTPAPPAAGTTKAATSRAKAGSPLAGDTRYTGTPATKTGEAWYQLRKKGSATATVRIEDTTVAGSTSCASIYAEVDNAAGDVESQTGLSDDGAVNFQVTTAGRYYIEIIGWDCTPTGLTTYSIEPETTTAWSAAVP